MQSDPPVRSDCKFEAALEPMATGFDSSPFPVAIVCGPSHLIQYANAAFCRVLDQSADLIVGSRMETAMPAEKNCIRLIDRVRRTARAQTHTEPLDANPSAVLWSYQGWPIDPDNPDGGVVIQISESVTHHEKAVAMNEALMLSSLDQHELRENVEDLVRVRTAELRETVAELESFSYSIAHDLRAPLRSMSGFAEILLSDHSGQLNPGGRLCLNRIVKSAGVMDQLIRDVLNYGQILRANPVLGPVDMDLLIQETKEHYPIFSQPGADIQIEGPFPRVLGNAALLMQVVSHLLGNAIKFTKPDQRPAVRVWSESGDRLVRFYVKDSGIGIPKDQHERIFGVFEQLDQVQDGTGIGLAIVKKAVERMGGAVGVISEPGQGATFWFDAQMS